MMTRRVAFAGCLLAGASCLFADDPVTENGVPIDGVLSGGAINFTPAPEKRFKEDFAATAEALRDNGGVRPDGVRWRDDDRVDPAEVICLDFESNAPCLFSETNPIRELYAGQGIHFEGPSELDGGAIVDQCGNWGLDARSGVNFLGFSRSGGQMRNGGFPKDPETVRFDSEASAVSVWVSGGRTTALWKMDAFDAGGNLITSGTVSSVAFTYAELAVSGSGIRSVVVTETSGDGAFLWDDFCVTLGGSGDCLTLGVDPLVAGQSADWNVSGATPNERVAIVYGFSPGSTVVNGFGGYCASFGIQGVNQNRVVCTKLTNGAGNVSCTRMIPAGVKGRRVLSQAAERNTCPAECVSNLDDQVVQ